MESVLDPAVLADLRQLEDEGDEGIIDELIDAFLAGAPDRLAAIHEELAAGNAEGVRFLAHALKGSSGVLGARNLANACRLLEEHACSGLDGGGPMLVCRLECEFERARAAFISMRESTR